LGGLRRGKGKRKLTLNIESRQGAKAQRKDERKLNWENKNLKY